jgi:hypothetical protein
MFVDMAIYKSVVRSVGDMARQAAYGSLHHEDIDNKNKECKDKIRRSY